MLSWIPRILSQEIRSLAPKQSHYKFHLLIPKASEGEEKRTSQMLFWGRKNRGKKTKKTICLTSCDGGNSPRLPLDLDMVVLGLSCWIRRRREGLELVVEVGGWRRKRDGEQSPGMGSICRTSRSSLLKGRARTPRCVHVAHSKIRRSEGWDEKRHLRPVKLRISSPWPISRIIPRVMLGRTHQPRNLSGVWLPWLQVH